MGIAFLGFPGRTVGVAPNQEINVLNVGRICLLLITSIFSVFFYFFLILGQGYWPIQCVWGMGYGYMEDSVCMFFQSCPLPPYMLKPMCRHQFDSHGENTSLKWVVSQVGTAFLECSKESPHGLPSIWKNKKIKVCIQFRTNPLTRKF